MRRLGLDRLGKKLRGTRRRLRELREWADQFSEWFPRLESFENGYWHWHLPVDRLYVDGRKVRRSTQRQVIEIMLEICAKLKENKPSADEPIRVIAIVKVPGLFFSDLTVFLGSEHLDGFFDRNTDDQRWTPLPTSRSLRREWGLTVGSDLTEFGMCEAIDDDYHFRGEIWFYGDLPTETLRALAPAAE